MWYMHGTSGFEVEFGRSVVIVLCKIAGNLASVFITSLVDCGI